MTEQPGLVCAYHIGEDKKATELTFDEVKKINKKPEGPGWYWIHMDCDDQPTREWLTNYKGMLNSVATALGSVRSRPRCTIFERGILTILRGINTNAGDDPEDMLSVRIWMNDKIVITTRREKLMAIDDIRTAFQKGKGPQTPSELFMELSESLVARMMDTIEEVDTKLEKLEDNKDLLDLASKRSNLFEVRSAAITLLRFITPQRGAIDTLITSESKFFDKEQLGRLRIMKNSICGNLEELTSIKERAIALDDAILGAENERMNKALYLLAIITALFMPLTLFTGLLGINVGGMPGQDWVPAFWLVLIIMGIMSWATYKLMKDKDLL